jgi:hypothetical protein
MLGRVFWSQNDTVASKHCGAREKIYFFSPHVSRARVSRGKWHAYSCPRCAGSGIVLSDVFKILIMIKFKTPSFRQAPECPIIVPHIGRVAGALKGLSVMYFILLKI